MTAAELKNRILAAARRRVRPGMVNIGTERFAVEFRVYPAKELTEIIDRLKKANLATRAAILAEQTLDPADKRPLFTGAEVEALPNPDLEALAEAFFRANFGNAEKN